MANSESKIARTATQALILLWKLGLFRSLKNKSSIEERLAKMGNNFSDAELGMALKRAKHLTRKGKRGSYAYIQKHPFVSEAEGIVKKKKA